MGKKYKTGMGSGRGERHHQEGKVDGHVLVRERSNQIDHFPVSFTHLLFLSHKALSQKTIRSLAS